MKQAERNRWARARALRAVALRQEGKTFREIGQILGDVSDDMARMLVFRGERVMQYEEMIAERKREKDKWERIVRLKPEHIEVP